MKNVPVEKWEIIRRMNAQTRQGLIPLKSYRPRGTKTLTAGQGKMCSFSGNV